MKQYKTVPDFFRENAEKDQKTETEILEQKARQALDGLTGLYLEQINTDVVIMKELLQKAKKASDKKRLNIIREDFFLKVHDMKGQGTTFGYPLLSDLGKVACDYLRHKTEVSLADLDYLSLLVADIQTVLDKKLVGKGGRLGTEIKKRWIKDNQ